MSKITDTHPQYTKRVASWAKIRDAIEGEDAIKERGERYLPKPSGQTLKNYEAYKMRAVFYGIADRTLLGLVGMVVRSEPSFELPDTLEPRREIATSKGTALDVLVQEVLTEVLSVGRVGVLVDFPAREVPAGTPPYFSLYRTEAIINWEVGLVDDMQVLTRVVLTEGEHGALKLRELILIDSAYHVRVYTQLNVKGEFSMTEDIEVRVNGATINYIPFTFIGPYDLNPDVPKPPMTDLVNMNLAHYRNNADYEHALYLTAQPTPWLAANIVAADRPKSMGSGSIWYLPENGTAGMLEFTGAGTAAQQQAITDKEARMAVLGARLIIDTSTSSNIAADTVRLKSRADSSVLTSSVRMVAAAVQKILRWAADWTKAPPDKIKVNLNTDFVETRLTGDDALKLVTVWQKQGFSRETLHELFQRGELIPGSRSVQEEVALIESDPLSQGLGSTPPDATPQASNT